MKNTREHIKALLLIGESPTGIIATMETRLRDGKPTARDLKIFTALVEDAMILADAQVWGR